MSGIGADEDVEETNDPRTEEQRRIDDDYNALVERIAGSDAVEVPMKQQLDTTGQGLVLVVTDPSDLGYHFSSTEAPVDVEMGELAAAAIRFAFEVLPEE